MPRDLDRITAFAGLWQGLAAGLEHPDADGRARAAGSPLGFLPDYALTLGLSVSAAESVRARWRVPVDEQDDLVWRREHTELFVFGFPRPKAPPYESVYLGDRRLLSQAPAGEVAAAYRTGGVAVVDGVGLPPDHLVFELEFMAHLARQAATLQVQGEASASAECASALDSFVREHPARWVQLLLADVEEHAASGYYPALFRVLASSLDLWQSSMQN